MALPEPRQGDEDPWHILPETNYAVTVGDPERVLWSSIKQMTARDLAESILFHTHNIDSKLQRTAIARNLKLYINQAFEFYEAAQVAKANTAPLFYYYSFLNLAKSLCEIRYPKFYERAESYHHGLTWHPSPKYYVNMEKESVLISTRGVWHALLDAVEGQRHNIANPTKIRIKRLFALCPEISIEFQRTYAEPPNLIDLVEPKIFYDSRKGKAKIWIRFAIPRDDLKTQGISRPRLLGQISKEPGKYHQVRSEDTSLWIFELQRPKDVPRRYREEWCQLLMPEIHELNVFTHLSEDGLAYFIPVQTRLPIRLRQTMVIYTLMFWLGSLVRYDPHSVAELQDSHYWLLIDGFMNQSRLWLLELFEWELYQTETTLTSAR